MSAPRRLRRSTVVILACAVIIASGLLAAGYLLASNADSTRDDVASNTVAIRTATAAARDAKRAARKASDAVEQVQRSRLENCRKANDRHDAAIAELDRQIALLPAARRAEARARRQGTVSLLTAIVPHQKCRLIITPPRG